MQPTRRDYLLQAMGINQWKLVKPESFKGVISNSQSNKIKLVILAEEELNSQDQFLIDLLRALDLQLENCLYSTFDFALNLNLTNPAKFLILGADSIKLDEFSLKLSAESIWQTLELTHLKKSPLAKRELWRQIQSTN